MKRSSASFIIVCSFNASIAGLAIPMLPVIIDALSRNKGGVDSRALGLLAFLELGGAAVTSIAASWKLRKLNPTHLCAWGSLILAAADALSTFALSSTPLLLSLRLAAGIGTGLMSSGMLALLARIPNPERMYGIIAFAPCVSASLGFTLAPNLIGITGTAAGVFAFWGFVAAANAVCVFVYRKRLIDYVEAAGARRRGMTLESVSAAPVAVDRIGERVGSGIYLLSAGSIFLLAFCDSAVWAFVGPIGEQIGLSIDNLSRILIATAIVACFGPLTAARLGSRSGVLPPIIIGQVLMIVLSLVIVLARRPALFGLALSLRVAAVLFLVPRYSGLFARIDPVGRVVSAAIGSQGIAYGVGPLIGGQLIALRPGSYTILGVAAAAAAGLSLGMTLLLVCANGPPDTQVVRG